MKGGCVVSLAAYALLSFPLAWAADLSAAPDNYIWLEAQHDPAAVAWAKVRTDKAHATLAGNPAFPEILNELKHAQKLSAPIPTLTLLGDKIARFSRDAEHPAGLLEVAHRGPNGLPEGVWRTVLDIAALNKREGKNYEFVFLDLAQQCLAPAFNRCLLPLSLGGSSSTEHREFDISTGKFVEDGFKTPVNRSQISWLDENTVLVAHTLDGSPALNSANPAILRLWKRGTPLSAARPIFRAAPTDSLFFFRTMGQGASSKAVLSVVKDYTTIEVEIIDRSGRVSDTGLPAKLKYLGTPVITGPYVVVQLAEPATLHGQSFAAESLLAYDTAVRGHDAPIHGVLAPDPGSYVNDGFSGMTGSKSGFAMILDHNLSKSLVFVKPGARGWSTTSIMAAPAGVAMTVASVDELKDSFLVREEGFLRPTRISLVRSDGKAIEIQSRTPVIDASGFISEVRSARSKDGTMIDYYLVRPKNPRPGPVPTILEGYGGYGVNIDPNYFSSGLALTLPSWLSRGGALAVAAIRGGGERGAAWHLEGSGRNKQKSYDDFIAVAEDLISSGFTAPHKIGSYGRSNGGLLSAVAATERPDLFGASLIGTPIVDIFRLGKGDSGISGGMKAEYGDWDDPVQIPAILSYSPYQNIRSGVTYPRMLLITSTEDNQVGPGHARRFAARLEEVGADPLLIEGPTGGHGFPNQFSQPEEAAMQIVFFIDALMK
jgi:prolyl oligopeptidase